jgi:hypothetical protein
MTTGRETHSIISEKRKKVVAIFRTVKSESIFCILCQVMSSKWMRHSASVIRYATRINQETRTESEYRDRTFVGWRPAYNRQGGVARETVIMSVGTPTQWQPMTPLLVARMETFREVRSDTATKSHCVRIPVTSLVSRSRNSDVLFMMDIGRFLVDQLLSRSRTQHRVNVLCLKSPGLGLQSWSKDSLRNGSDHSVGSCQPGRSTSEQDVLQAVKRQSHRLMLEDSMAFRPSMTNDDPWTNFAPRLSDQSELIMTLCCPFSISHPVRRVRGSPNQVCLLLGRRPGRMNHGIRAEFVSRRSVSSLKDSPED